MLLEIKPSVRRMARPSIVITCWLGLAFLMSGPSRLSADAYRGVVATGGSHFWGAVFLTVSGMLIYGSHHSHHTMKTAYTLSGTAFLLLTFAFTYSVIRYDTANLTAPAAYAGLAYFQFFAANEMNKPENRDHWRE